MENENKNYEYDMEPEVNNVDVEETGVGTGLAMLIGSGLTLTTIAAVKLAKKVYAKIKTKKDLRLVDEHDFVEPTDEQIEAVTK